MILTFQQLVAIRHTIVLHWAWHGFALIFIFRFITPNFGPHTCMFCLDKDLLEAYLYYHVAALIGRLWLYKSSSFSVQYGWSIIITLVAFVHRFISVGCRQSTINSFSCVVVVAGLILIHVYLLTCEPICCATLAALCRSAVFSCSCMPQCRL